jgi:hypothetical protein
LNPPFDEGKPVGGGILDQIVVPYAGADIQGTLTSTVLVGDISNPFGGLTFIYEIATDLSSTAPVEQFSVGNFGLGPIDASVSLFGAGPGDSGGASSSIAVGGLAPVYAGRTFNGNVISFDYALFGNPGLMPGDYSAAMVVQTDSPFYEPTISSVINSGSAEVASFAPIAVPEPTTFALVGLGSFLLLRARKRN